MIKKYLQNFSPNRRSGMFLACCFVFVCLLGALSMSAVQDVYAAINKQINYQGKLTNTSGSTVPDGTYNMEFKLYTVSSGGSPLWTETRTSADKVQVTNGLFSVLLGEVTSLSAVDFNQTLYLGVNIGGTSTPGWDGEMTPRKKLGAVPAAIVAETLNGLYSTQFFRTDTTNSTSSTSTFLKVEQLGTGPIAEFLASSSNTVLGVYAINGGRVGIGTTTPLSKLHVSGGDIRLDTGYNVLVPNGTYNVAQFSLDAYSTGISMTGNDEVYLTGNSIGVLGVKGTANPLVKIKSNAVLGWNAGLVNGTPDTAFSRFAANTVALGNGTALSATGTLLVGNLGIGSTTPGATLAVKGTAGTNPFIVASSSGAQLLTLTQTGNLGIGSSSPSAALTVTGSMALSGAFIDANNTAGTAGMVLQTTSTGTQWVSTSSLAIVGGSSSPGGSDGNVQFNSAGGFAGEDSLFWDSTNDRLGIGTSSPAEKLHVAGNILIGARSDSNPTWTLRSDTTPGTIASGGTSSIGSTTAMAVYNGSLYIGTSKANAAEIYRYNGSTWTQVSSTTAGYIGTSTVGNINTISTMVVWDGQLYVGTSETGNAEVYRYDGNSNWTRISSTTPGAIGGNSTSTAINSISAMTVHGGRLYIGTSKANGAEIFRYNGPGLSMAQSWTRVSHITTIGTIGATANVDAVTALVSFNGYLFAGTSEAGSSGGLYRYDGQGTTGTGFTIIGTAGTFSGTNANGSASAITAYGTVDAMAVYNGRLYVGIDDGAGTARVVKWDGSLTAGTAYELVSSTTAGIIAEDIGATTGIDRIGAMSVYNNDLYVGTIDSTGIAEVYKLDDAETWTKYSSTTAGTLNTGGTSAILGIYAMNGYNDDLWVGTGKSLATEVYSFNMIEGQSYNLAFEANSDDAESIQNGLGNRAWIQFQSEEGGYNNTGNVNTGSFVFSHGINTVTGAYDLAEDYPTDDDTLAPGDLVSLDTRKKGFVRKAQGKNDKDVIGIYSVDPALRLSQKGGIEGARAVPVALAGRVPVSVTLENGAIRIGDYLTSSMEPGKAAKATKPGRVIGRALGAYGGLEGEEPKVTVFIGAESITWNDLQSAEENIAELSESGIPSDQNAIIEFIDKVNESAEDIVFAVLNKTDNVSLIITNKFTALVASIQELFVKTFTLLPGGSISLPTGDNQAAGIGFLAAGATDVFISNEQIDDNTIIYITPTSAIESPLYIGAKIKGKGFHVRTKEGNLGDITFDWFFVKTYKTNENESGENPEVTRMENGDNGSTSTTTITIIAPDAENITSQGSANADTVESVSSAPDGNDQSNTGGAGENSSEVTNSEPSTVTSEGDAITAPIAPVESPAPAPTPAPAPEPAPEPAAPAPVTE